METISGLSLAEEKEMAFTSLNAETSVPIDTTQHAFSFTRNWFRSRNQSTWSTFLLPKFPPTEPCRMLQIGVFEGMDLVWCLQNILQHPDSRAIAVDPWVRTTKLSQETMDGVRDRAHLNLRPWLAEKKVTIYQRYSQDLLPALDSFPFPKTDLAIIDGDHTADAVYDDAVGVLPLMKKGGWMVFDDVRNRIDKKDHVQDGLMRFYLGHRDKVKRLWLHRYCDCLEVL